MFCNLSPALRTLSTAHFEQFWTFFPPRTLGGKLVHPEQTFYTAAGLFSSFFQQRCQVLKSENNFAINVRKNRQERNTRGHYCVY